MFIQPGQLVRVEDLLKGMIVQSGNDATMALAEGLFGSEEAFVQHMNATAQRLGMRNTGYRNPEGLTAPGHVTTARATWPCFPPVCWLIFRSMWAFTRS